MEDNSTKFRFPQDSAFKIFARLKTPNDPSHPFRKIRYSPDKRGKKVRPAKGLECLLKWFDANWTHLPDAYYFVLAENKEQGEWQAVFSMENRTWQPYDEWKLAQSTPEKPVTVIYRSTWRLLIKYDQVIVNYRLKNNKPANDLWYNQAWMDTEATLLEKLRTLRHVQEIVVWDNAAPPASRQAPYCRICPRTFQATKPMFDLQSA